MRYFRQLLLIALFSFLGEVLHMLLPWPIPASIYGMVLLFAALGLEIIRPKSIADAGGFLTTLLPVLFVAPLVSLMDCWEALAPVLWQVVVVLLVTTVITFAVSGIVTQLLLRKKVEKDE